MKNKNLKPLILILLLLSGSVFAQSNSKQIFKELKQTDEFMGITIPGFLVRTGAWFIPDEDFPAEAQEIVSKVKNIRLLHADAKQHNTTSGELFNMLSNKLDDCVYEELMTINDGNDDVNIRINEIDGTIKEFLFYGQSDSDIFFVIVNGNFNLQEIGTLIKQLNQSYASN